MNDNALNARHGNIFGLLYLTSFIFSFHLFFVIYMNSSFLSTLVPEAMTGLIYMWGSVLSIITLLYVSKMFRIFGNYKLLLWFSVLELFIFTGLAFIEIPWLLITLFILHVVIAPLIFLNFDIFLEAHTKDEGVTGSIRGIYGAIINTALILAPLVAGFVLTDGDYWKIYILSAAFLVPFLALITKFKDFEDPEYHSLEIFQTVRCLFRNKDLYNIFMAQFFLRFFFSWMVIYMPLYLHNHIGFTWTEIGIMTSIMLLPFVLVEFPAGKIADKYTGEKELLITGFLITALFTAFISFIEVSDIIIWTALLFTIRIGASLIEIMTEVYFFKHVSGTDNNTMSFFRMMRPLSYVIGPAVASTILLFTDFRYIFILLGVIMLFGLKYSFALHDTK